MTATVIAAIDRLIEAAAIRQRDRATKPLVTSFAKKLRAAFKKQEAAVFVQFRKLEDKFAASESGRLEEASDDEPDWEPLFSAAAEATTGAFEAAIDEAVQAALLAGGAQAVATFSVDTTFDMDNPRAVDYAKGHAAELVSQINDTTRARIKALVAQALDEGWSYGQLATQLRDLYSDFHTPAPQKHLKDRAEAIAVYEMGAAYEAGNRAVIDDLQAGGIDMEQSWLTAGDDRVRPEHAANEAEGWIPLDQAFSSGDDGPPTDPGCRCTLLYRRKADDA